jgi:hypothetical protein
LRLVDEKFLDVIKEYKLDREFSFDMYTDGFDIDTLTDNCIERLQCQNESDYIDFVAHQTSVAIDDTQHALENLQNSSANVTANDIKVYTLPGLINRYKANIGHNCYVVFRLMKDYKVSILACSDN